MIRNPVILGITFFSGTADEAVEQRGFPSVRTDCTPTRLIASNVMPNQDAHAVSQISIS
jgi:hypothetical protein